MNKEALIKLSLRTIGLDDRRFTLEWVSAAEAKRFIRLITDFTSQIRSLGPLGEQEGLERGELMRRLEAVSLALKGTKVRMAFARQAKQMNKDGTHGRLTSEEKMSSALRDEMILYETFLYLREKNCTASELAELLRVSEDQVAENIETLRKKKIWDGDLLTA